MSNSIAKKSRILAKPHSPDFKTVKIRTELNGLGVFKTLVVLSLIAIQFIVFACLYVWLALIFKWYVLASFILSVITCVFVLSSKKNGQSKAVWIMLVLLFFSFGYIVYLLSDERIFFRKAKRRYTKVFSSAAKYNGDYVVPKVDNLTVCNDSKFLYQAGKFATYNNTAIKYFSSGSQLFDDVIESLKKAKKFIFIEYFIIADGVLLNKIFNILAQKVKQGADVRIIYDDMGSHRSFSRKMKRKIKNAGIQLFDFNRLIPRFSVALNYRDHRKMIIIDGKTAYSGGCNLADEYINAKRMYGYWKDTGVRLDGQAVDSFTLIFLRQWEYLAKKQEDYSPYFGHSKNHDNAAVVIPFADGLDYKLPIGKNVYENIIAAAKEKLYIMMPYFIPDDTITNLVINKALAGVDVRIILPGIPDKAFVYNVSRNNAEKLIDYGVKLYCMKNSFVHSKLVISENCAVIGSINVDLRSFYQQFECAVYTNDTLFMSDIFKDFQATFLDCEQITQKNKSRRCILNRIFSSILQLFAPLM